MHKACEYTQTHVAFTVFVKFCSLQIQKFYDVLCVSITHKYGVLILYIISIVEYIFHKHKLLIGNKKMNPSHKTSTCLKIRRTFHRLVSGLYISNSVFLHYVCASRTQYQTIPSYFHISSAHALSCPSTSGIGIRDGRTIPRSHSCRRMSRKDKTKHR